MLHFSHARQSYGFRQQAAAWPHRTCVKISLPHSPRTCISPSSSSSTSGNIVVHRYNVITDPKRHTDTAIANSSVQSRSTIQHPLQLRWHHSATPLIHRALPSLTPKQWQTPTPATGRDMAARSRIANPSERQSIVRYPAKPA